MVSKCNSCGFTSDDMDARFCPNCGGTLEAVVAQQPAPASNACPKCGSTANAPGARFCQQCGSSLGGVQPVATVQPVVTPAAVTPAVAYSASGAKTVTGMKIKMMPIAKMIEGGLEQSGLIELHSDGIIFYGKHMSILASLHVSDIARADPGMKSNLLDVKMKDGSVKTFKFMNARDWAGLVNSNVR
ncbi:MAG: zinc ribbon domain-containing protein [Candidatus Lokiarchaeota archaeon]|nr:zinc ribbon domain-containing protein [Candidatus Lokiarchaeota archaeon]